MSSTSLKAANLQTKHFKETRMRKTIDLFYNGKKYKVRPLVNRYQSNGNLAVWLYCRDLADLDVTININPLPQFMAAFNVNFPHSEDILKAIIECGFAEPTGESVQSGFVTYPIYRFNRDVLYSFDTKGTTIYEQSIDCPPEPAKSLKEQFPGAVIIDINDKES